MAARHLSLERYNSIFNSTLVCVLIAWSAVISHVNVYCEVRHALEGCNNTLIVGRMLVFPIHGSRRSVKASNFMYCMQG